MSRVVPQDQPLSDEDRLYLHNRGRTDQIAYLDQQYPPDPEALAAFNRKLAGDPAPTGEFEAALARVALLERYITEDLGADLPDESGDEVDERPYSEWLVSELQEEAGRRGLSKTGNKPELVARLEEYDAAQ